MQSFVNLKSELFATTFTTFKISEFEFENVCTITARMIIRFYGKKTLFII